MGEYPPLHTFLDFEIFCFEGKGVDISKNFRILKIFKKRYRDNNYLIQFVIMGKKSSQYKAMMRLIRIWDNLQIMNLKGWPWDEILFYNYARTIFTVLEPYYLAWKMSQWIETFGYHYFFSQETKWPRCFLKLVSPFRGNMFLRVAHIMNEWFLEIFWDEVVTLYPTNFMNIAKKRYEKFYR